MTTVDTHTVTSMAEAETKPDAFEDVVVGTYPDLVAAMAAASDYARKNEATCQVMSALPADPKFNSWDSLRALVYMDEDHGTTLITETF